MYRDPIRPVPSPMYDYLSIKPYTRTNETGLAIGNAREFNAVTADQLVFVATRAGASPKLVVTAADAMVDRFIDEWKRFRNDVSSDIRTVIDAQALASRCCATDNARARSAFEFQADRGTSR